MKLPLQSGDSHVRLSIERLVMGVLRCRSGLEPIVLTDAERARIDACMDVETLDGWIDRVFGAKTAAEVLT